jgi:hypothetical protein
LPYLYPSFQRFQNPKRASASIWHHLGIGKWGRAIIWQGCWSLWGPPCKAWHSRPSWLEWNRTLVVTFHQREVICRKKSLLALNQAEVQVKSILNISKWLVETYRQESLVSSSAAGWDLRPFY